MVMCLVGSLRQMEYHMFYSYSAFWMGENGINPNTENLRFQVMVKKTDSPKVFEKGFRKRMQAQPWAAVATFEWKEGHFTANIPVVEKL